MMSAIWRKKGSRDRVSLTLFQWRSSEGGWKTYLVRRISVLERHSHDPGDAPSLAPHASQARDKSLLCELANLALDHAIVLGRLGRVGRVGRVVAFVDERLWRRSGHAILWVDEKAIEVALRELFNRRYTSSPLLRHGRIGGSRGEGLTFASLSRNFHLPSVPSFLIRLTSKSRPTCTTLSATARMNRSTSGSRLNWGIGLVLDGDRSREPCAAEEEDACRAGDFDRPRL